MTAILVFLRVEDDIVLRSDLVLIDDDGRADDRILDGDAALDDGTGHDHRILDNRSLFDDDLVGDDGVDALSLDDGPLVDDAVIDTSGLADQLRPGEGVGGKENVTSIDNCITRLRLEIVDQALVDEKKIKSAGVAGVIRPGKNSVQVVVGTKVQFVADEFKKLYK